MKGMIRQGDVLLIPVTDHRVKVPAHILPVSEVVLAEGELTGHAHRLAGREVYEWSVSGQRYVRVVDDRPGTIAHEDHDPVPAAVIEPNVTYRVVQQREWDLRGQWQDVRD